MSVDSIKNPTKVYKLVLANGQSLDVDATEQFIAAVRKSYSLEPDEEITEDIVKRFITDVLMGAMKNT